MLKKLIISILLVCSITQVAFAATTKTGYIQVLHAANSANIFVSLNVESINPANCLNSSYILPYANSTFSSDPSEGDTLTYKDKYKSMYSLIVAAKIAGQRIRLRIHDTECINNYPLITLVTLL